MVEHKWQYITLLLMVLALVSAAGALEITTPEESLYDITINISDSSQCSKEEYQTICTSISELEFKQCEMLSEDCDRTVKLRLSFSNYKAKDVIESYMTNKQSHRGLTFSSAQVSDVNECTEEINQCSKNGYCTNTVGAYRCQCKTGFQEISSSTNLPGTYCVAICISRSCKNKGVCTAAADEDTDVTCECQSGYVGDTCQDRLGVSSLSMTSVILIAVAAGVAALVGIGLCTFALYRLFCRGAPEYDFDDTSSISTYKPTAIPSGDYERMTDLGSVSRSNRAFASTIDEESEGGGSIRSGGFKRGTRLMSSRLSIPSEHGDPTPVLDPYRTDRHAASDIISQPDYY